MKICGLTRDEDVRAAVDAGADAVGFITGFPSSPRNVTLERASTLMRSVPPFVDRVLVAPIHTVKEHLEDVRLARPDALQVYTDQVVPRAFLVALGTRLIRPYRLKSRDPRDAVAAAAGFDALLTDTYQAGLQGGTGRVSDWSLCRDIRDAIAPTPLILSGGLNPENVETAIRTVNPFAVDASSGVESAPGVKDPVKVAELIRRAKSVH